MPSAAVRNSVRCQFLLLAGQMCSPLASHMVAALVEQNGVFDTVTFCGRRGVAVGGQVAFAVRYTRKAPTRPATSSQHPGGQHPQPCIAQRRPRRSSSSPGRSRLIAIIIGWLGDSGRSLRACAHSPLCLRRFSSPVTIDGTVSHADASTLSVSAYRRRATPNRSTISR